MARTTHFVALDWIRGIAALLVFAMHFELSASTSRIFAHGYLAVDLFFVISGFVIAHSYEKLMLKPNGRFDFAVTRLIRLYPLALLGSLVGILTWLTGHVATHHIALTLVCQILLIPQLWQGATLFLLNSVHWSLMLEILANIVHALGIRRLSVPPAAAVVAIGWIAIIASAWHWGSLSVGYARTNALGGVARVIFGYGSGVLLHRLAAIGHLPRLRIPALMVIPLPLVLLIPGMAIFDHFWFADVVVVTLLPFMLAAALASDVPDKMHRAARALGQLSYPLYAIHLPLVTTAIFVITTSGIAGATRLFALACIIPIVIGIALFVQYSYDAPVRRWLTRHLHARLIRTPAASAP